MQAGSTGETWDSRLCERFWAEDCQVTPKEPEVKPHIRIGEHWFELVEGVGYSRHYYAYGGVRDVDATTHGTAEYYRIAYEAYVPPPIPLCVLVPVTMKHLFADVQISPFLPADRECASKLAHENPGAVALAVRTRREVRTQIQFSARVQEKSINWLRWRTTFERARRELGINYWSGSSEEDAVLHLDDAFLLIKRFVIGPMEMQNIFGERLGSDSYDETLSFLCCHRIERIFQIEAHSTRLVKMNAMIMHPKWLFHSSWGNVCKIRTCSEQCSMVHLCISHGPLKCSQCGEEILEHLLLKTELKELQTLQTSSQLTVLSAEELETSLEQLYVDCPFIFRATVDEFHIFKTKIVALSLTGCVLAVQLIVQFGSGKCTQNQLFQFYRLCHRDHDLENLQWMFDRAIEIVAETDAHGKLVLRKNIDIWLSSCDLAHLLTILAQRRTDTNTDIFDKARLIRAVRQNEKFNGLGLNTVDIEHALEPLTSDMAIRILDIMYWERGSAPFHDLAVATNALQSSERFMEFFKTLKMLAFNTGWQDDEPYGTVYLNKDLWSVFPFIFGIPWQDLRFIYRRLALSKNGTSSLDRVYPTAEERMAKREAIRAAAAKVRESNDAKRREEAELEARKKAEAKEAATAKREKEAAEARIQRQERANAVVQKTIQTTTDSWKAWESTRQVVHQSKALSARHVQPHVLEQADEQLKERLRECQSYVESAWKREKGAILIIQKHWRWRSLRVRFFRSINLGEFDIPSRGRVKWQSVASGEVFGWERARATGDGSGHKLTQGGKRAARKKAQKEKARAEQRGRVAMSESCPSRQMLSRAHPPASPHPPSPPHSPAPPRPRSSMIVGTVVNSRPSSSVSGTSTQSRTDGPPASQTRSDTRTMRAIQVIQTVRECEERREIALQRRNEEMERVARESQASREAELRQANSRRAALEARQALAEVRQTEVRRAAAMARQAAIASRQTDTSSSPTDEDDPATKAWLKQQVSATREWALGGRSSSMSTDPSPVDPLQAPSTCVVCHENEPTYAAVPCGHRCACADCHGMLKACPLCRQTPDMWIKIYLT